MILRSVMRHVRDQNWFAVVLDFFIVVVGVFIGIQVANWNEELAQQDRANSYRESLASDLQNDIRRVENAIELKEGVIEFGRTALAFARDRQFEDPWPVVYAFFQASQAGGIIPVNTAYQELTASGDVRLIGELEVRQQLSDYYTESNVYEIVVVLPAYREAVRGLIPFEIQEYIWSHCYRSGRNSQKLLPCDAPPSTTGFSEVAASLVANEPLIRQLRFWLSNETAALLILKARRSDAETLRGALLNK